MRVLGVISARGGSKEVPRKNLRDLNGVPLITHILNKAKRCEMIDLVICSTDSEHIAGVARDCGVDVPFMRPAELAQDRVPLVLSTKYAMQSMDELGYHADVVVQLSPTCPFLRVQSIDEAVRMAMLEDCDCSVSLKKIEHEHPYRARIVSDDGSFVNFVQDVDVEAERYHSRQDLPDLYCTTGGIYARKRYLLDQYDGTDFAMGQKRKGLILDDIESVNIDRMLDYYFAEFMCGRIDREKYLGAAE